MFEDIERERDIGVSGLERDIDWGIGVLRGINIRVRGLYRYLERK